MAKKKTTKKTLDLTLPIFQLKISLRHVTPTIWRRVQIDDCTLDELHDIIQIAMGWQDEHMFAFVIDGEQYGDLERGGDFDHDSRSVRLSDLAEQGHTRFQYDYDFGDEWTHIIEIEKTLPVEEGGFYPRCVKGERACPPEDCGGPYEYPYFLEKLQDPKQEEHEEMLEWVGDDFDPEEFDLDKVNDELRYLRRFLGHGKVKHSKSAFIEGDLVHVKPGIVHDQFPDIPLGGWAGNVSRVIWLTPIGYEVDWTESTLQQAHPVYRKRCQRDGIAPETFWLEADQLNEATDESPVEMEQPTNLIARPLSMDEAHDRVRVVFGLTSDDALPKADEHTQQQFLDYLKAKLSFPFKAEYWPTTAIGPDKGGKVTVLGFSDPPLNREVGIVCEARMGKREVQVPLLGLQVNEDDPNAQYVADYTYWLWDANEGEKFEDDDIDEDDDTDEETIGDMASKTPIVCDNMPFIPKELMEMVKAQRQKFIAKFGRNPGPGDKLFFDAPPLEHVEHMISQAMKKVGVDPAIIHAFEKTGLIVTEANQHLLKGADLEDWNAAINEFNAKAEPPQFPIGTVAYYGPDDKTTTKIVAGVIKMEGADAIIKRWVATDVMTNPKVQKEIERFFQKHGVTQVAMSDGNLGCPHEEGEDFPDGGDCPFCPWWKGKQGSGARQ